MYYYYEDSLDSNLEANDPPLLSPPSPSPSPSSPLSSCAQGHRSSLILKTQEGGSICLLCFSNLISNPNSPTFHVSYALSQLSHAVSQPSFITRLLSFHIHLLLSPLVLALSSFDDDQIARQITDLIADLCGAGGSLISGDFVARIADAISSSSLAWSRRQVYSLHCLGILLTRQADTYACIKDHAALVYNLLMGLQLPSEEIRGEIMFVLYRICILQYSCKDDKGADIMLEHCPLLLHLSLDALMKTQRDDVRLNCIALLKVLGQRGFLSDAFSGDFNMMDTCEAVYHMQTTDDESNGTSLITLFSEAIKSPLLSSDSQLQISTLDFLFHCLLRGDCSGKQIEVLVQENVADYIFEILRLSEQEDQVISSCLQVLDLLSTAEEAFKQKLAMGFTTLVSVLPHIAEVPFHPTQAQMLKLVLSGISSFPGMVSTKHIEEISSALALMLKRHTAGDLGMISETFATVCSIFVALMKSPSASGTSTLISIVQESSTHAIFASLGIYDQDPNQLLHSLYLLKEAYAFGYEVNSIDKSTDMELSHSVIDLYQKHILPWFVTVINGMEEESILGILETLQFILSQGHDTRVVALTQDLLSLSWFRLSFGCLGMYPTEKMKLRVYLMLSSIVDNLLGDDNGESIRTAASALPADPIDLLYLLGQKSTNNLELSSCQSAVLQVLYISSLYDEMLADKKLVFASLEKYILANSSDLLYGAADSIVIAQLFNLYALYRGFAKLSYQIPYSSEAEKIFFELLAERDWDLSSFEIHPSSLKWLFQQDRISQLLSAQILKLCRKSCSNETFMNSRVLNFQVIAELTSVGDNLLPQLLVSLLSELVEEEMVTSDVISLLNLVSSIIYIFPDASNQLCMHGMGNAVQNLCSNSLHSSSLENYMVVSRFIFIILSTVNAQTLVDDQAWLTVIMKLLDSFTSATKANGWTEGHLLVISVLSLVLHHSTQGALTETSRFILLNTSLSSILRATIDELLANTFAAIEEDEGTSTEQALVLLLLFNHFCLRSLQAVLPGSVDWQNFLNPPEGKCMNLSAGILCQDLCRFLHFGPPWVKLVASYSLVELLTRITDHRNKQQPNDWKCIIGYLRSMAVVFEGLVFDSDLRISTNSCLCLSIVYGWEIPGVHPTSLTRSVGWCRIIMEELALSLAAPLSVSKSFMNSHNPAVHIATAILRRKTVPSWIKAVFNETCVSGIIENLSPNNISVEVVVLFQELMRSSCLKPDQIASLNHLLEVCRRRLHMENREDEVMGEQKRNTVSMSGNMEEVCEFLLQLMLSDTNFGGFLFGNSRLEVEIDLLFRLLAENERIDCIG